MIFTSSTNTPDYGEDFAVTLGFVGGDPVAIGRVVFNRVGGITHSNHFDQRQVTKSAGCLPAESSGLRMAQISRIW